MVKEMETGKVRCRSNSVEVRMSGVGGCDVERSRIRLQVGGVFLHFDINRIQFHRV